ncbi:MAG TPA: type II/IV secretion system protein [Phycisphaerales bacterium]|nr:type II/IV secretion system protein [Phycisphaerales bacterium]
MARSRKKLGEILVRHGATNSAQVEKALKMAAGAGKRIGEAMIEAGFVKEKDVAKALAEQFKMDYVDLSSPEGIATIQPDLIPEELIKKHFILPQSKTGNRMSLVVHDPMNIELLDMLRFRLNVEIDPKIAAKGDIKVFIENHFRAGGSIVDSKEISADQSLVTESIDRSIDSSVDRSMDKSIDVAGDDAPIVKLWNRILTEAVNMRASDIHLEPMADRVRLRYRIDGVCMERDNLPKRMQRALLSRIKLMAGMNIAEKRIPQDGRVKLPMGDDVVIDFRVSACPTYHGESLVMRILRPDAVRIGLANLGFEEENLEVFNKIIRRPNGIFLVTGPTGSGKTTTLYSALDVLNRPDKKIITAEDPVEYNFEGINQCQVKESIGFTFSAILRSMLRQAPNVILVGEIRDKEVGEIAIQAALTGHLVFSTLHTNDAPSAITRLIDMGIKPFLVASSIQAVMAQRLIRVLHDGSKELAEPHEIDHKFLRLIGLSPEEAEGRVYKPVPCAESPTGYKGRKAIFEMMLMDSMIREAAFKMAPVAELRKLAIQNGMKPLVEDGKRKVLAGVTTPDEVARVSQVEEATGVID